MQVGRGKSNPVIDVECVSVERAMWRLPIFYRYPLGSLACNHAPGSIVLVVGLLHGFTGVLQGALRLGPAVLAKAILSSRRGSGTDRP